MLPSCTSLIERDWSDGRTFQSVVLCGRCWISKRVTEGGIQEVIGPSPHKSMPPRRIRCLIVVGRFP